VRIVTASSDPPKDEDVRRFLEVVTDPSRQPVYFHCLRGKDRTGMMCAVYRMAVEGWPLEAARAEMQAFGFYDGWQDLLSYVEGFPAIKDRVWPALR
jgi:protein tyrosine/serine phosphatase